MLCFFFSKRPLSPSFLSPLHSFLHGHNAAVHTAVRYSQLLHNRPPPDSPPTPTSRLLLYINQTCDNCRQSSLNATTPTGAHQPSASNEVACVPETGWNRSIWNPHIFEEGNAGAIGETAVRFVPPQEEVLRQQAVALVFSRFQARIGDLQVFVFLFTAVCRYSLFSCRELAGGGGFLFWRGAGICFGKLGASKIPNTAPGLSCLVTKCSCSPIERESLLVRALFHRCKQPRRKGLGLFPLHSTK